MPKNYPPLLTIFSKIPGLAPCKTRLSTILSETERNKLMSAFLADTINCCLNSPFQELGLMSYPETTKEELCQQLIRYLAPLELPNLQKIDLKAQTGPTFSSRLTNCFDSYPKNQAVAVIGSDAPLLKPRLLEAAYNSLANGKSCLGPTPDGGLWLIGISSGARISKLNYRKVFEESKELDVCSLSKELSSLDQSFDLLPICQDVDLEEDLASLQSILFAERASANHGEQHYPEHSHAVLEKLQLKVTKNNSDNRRIQLEKLP